MKTQKEVEQLHANEVVKLFRKLLSKEEIIGLYNDGKNERNVIVKTKHYLLECDGHVYYAENFNAGTPMYLVYNDRDFIETLYKELQIGTE